jgi:hypothetical protein
MAIAVAITVYALIALLMLRAFAGLALTAHWTRQSLFYCFVAYIAYFIASLASGTRYIGSWYDKIG